MARVVMLRSLIIFIMFRTDGGASFHELPRLPSLLPFSHGVHERHNHQLQRLQPPQPPLLSYACERAPGLSWPRASHAVKEPYCIKGNQFYCCFEPHEKLKNLYMPNTLHITMLSMRDCTWQLLKCNNTITTCVSIYSIHH